MKELLLLLCIFASTASYAQKDIQISQNRATERFYKTLDSKLKKYSLEDLRLADKFALRIWKQNEIVILADSVRFTLHVSNGEGAVVTTRTFKNPDAIDSVYQKLSDNIDFSKTDQKINIDQFPITIEMSTSENYKVISFYDQRELRKIVADLFDHYELYSLRNGLIDELPAGTYRLGMSPVRVDHLVGDSVEKTPLYKRILEEASHRLDLHKSTKPTQLPLILIDDERGSFAEVNSLSEEDVESYRIVPDNEEALYGQSGRFGVILINTK